MILTLLDKHKLEKKNHVVDEREGVFVIWSGNGTKNCWERTMELSKAFYWAGEEERRVDEEIRRLAWYRCLHVLVQSSCPMWNTEATLDVFLLCWLKRQQSSLDELIGLFFSIVWIVDKFELIKHENSCQAGFFFFFFNSRILLMIIELH